MITQELLIATLIIGFLFGLLLAWCIAVVVLFPARMFGYHEDGQS